MPISVVCPGCKKRFNVSEKFAGQKGPCPSCKVVIQIPDKPVEDVVIHAPEAAGPKDSKGAAVIKPILRQETRFDLRMAIGVFVAIVVVFVAAWVVGSSFKPAKPGGPSEVPLWLKAIAALAVGPPLAFAGYSFLRNDEFEPYRGRELWTRVAACGAVYAILWGVFGYLPSWLGLKGSFEMYQLMYVAPPIVAAGGFAAYVCFELEMMMCVLHYGLYLLATVLLRATAGMNAY